MKTMKNSEIIKYINNAKMPDMEQVRANCLNQQENKTKNIQKNMNWRKITIITTAIMLSLTMMTAAAWKFGDIVKSIIFNGFEANKVDALIYNGKNVDAIWDYEITDPNVKIEPLTGDIQAVYFETVEEAAEHLDFTPKTLGYLPEGCSFKYVRLLKYNDKYNKNSCEIWYSDVLLVTKYVGENATIKITTTYADIEKIILNDGTEALLETIVTFPNGNSLYTLHWIKDGVGYMLGNSFEIDDLIKMAESVN